MLDSQTKASQFWETINYLILTILKDSIHSSLLVWKSTISRFTNINYDDILANGDIVKEGEVIRYTINITNKGNEILKDVKV